MALYDVSIIFRQKMGIIGQRGGGGGGLGDWGCRVWRMMSVFAQHAYSIARILVALFMEAILARLIASHKIPCCT